MAKTNENNLMQYKVVVDGNYVQTFVRNGRAWCPSYDGCSSPGRDLVLHFSEILESKGYTKYQKAKK